MGDQLDEQQWRSSSGFRPSQVCDHNIVQSCWCDPQTQVMVILGTENTRTSGADVLTCCWAWCGHFPTFRWCSTFSSGTLNYLSVWYLRSMFIYFLFNTFDSFFILVSGSMIPFNRRHEWTIPSNCGSHWLQSEVGHIASVSASCPLCYDHCKNRNLCSGVTCANTRLMAAWLLLSVLVDLLLLEGSLVVESSHYKWFHSYLTITCPIKWS